MSKHQDGADQKPREGTVIRSKNRSTPIPSFTRDGGKGFVVRIQLDRGDWLPCPDNRGLACFVTRKPQTGEEITVTHVAPHTVSGEIRART